MPAPFCPSSDYAKQKCKVVPEWMAGDFQTPWVYCPNCEQPFRSTLALDMATEFVSFVETTYSGGSNTWNKTKTLSSLQVKLQAACHVLAEELNGGLINLSADDDSKIRDDCKSLIDKFFALIDVAKQDKDLYQDSWVHLPKSSTKYQNYLTFRLTYEAQGCYFSGKFYSLVDESENSGNTALKYYKEI